jgi:hypothetical protein
MASTTLNFDNVLDCAGKCRTYHEFCERFPLVYSAAKHKGWLSAVKIHCGWTDDLRPRADIDVWHKQSLNEIINQDGCLLSEALDDPTWPYDLAPPAALSELI